jgi:hypothetical protein
VIASAAFLVQLMQSAGIFASAQNSSLSVNCADRGPPRAYSAFCPFMLPPPSMFVVEVPGHTLPKVESAEPP